MRHWFVTPAENQMIRTIRLITNSGDLFQFLNNPYHNPSYIQIKGCSKTAEPYVREPDM